MASQIPTYIVRYEDLRLNPAPVLKEAFAFLLNVPLEAISGTIVEKRIEKYSATGHATKAIYKLKSTSANLSRNRDIYTDDQIAQIETKLCDYIRFYGYTGQNEIGDDGTPETEFFDINNLKSD